MVPTRYFTFTPAAVMVCSATAMVSLRRSDSSRTAPVRGIMISGRTSTPSFCTAQAAPMIAATCISQISGKVRLRRQPRWPSMGFISCRDSILRSSSSWATPISLARALMSAGAVGRNSCRGGSSRRMVTGSPSMARKMPSKSSCCMGRILVRALRRAASLSARIISRIFMMRSSPKNMCSVRHSPMPWAPNSRAWRASCGVSALVRTLRRRAASAQSITVLRLGSSRLGGISGGVPSITAPVVPLMVIGSPALKLLPPTVIRPLALSTKRSAQPATQGLPMPRATTAAWLVMPPRLVRMPWATFMPAMSSGLVSRRTSTTLRPAAATATASSALKATSPWAAPGEAGRPVPSTFSSALGSICSCSIWSRCSGSTSSRAASVSTRPSRCISAAMRIAATPVRLPLRVCSIQRRPSWMVNSMSCMLR